MKAWTELRRSLVAALWFMFLTLPLVAIRVNPTEKLVLWRWGNLLWVGAGAFVLSLLSRWLLARRRKRAVLEHETSVARAVEHLRRSPAWRRAAILTLAVAALLFPLMSSAYQVSIMTTALLYVVLGLGLNIVVGLAGLLDLGYVAFYAVGAYTYALLHQHFGLGFWAALPVGGLLGAVFGILLGFPVLRLRGDYLAIVTLGFGEIIRLVLENWSEFSSGPSGIAGIPRPSLFGLNLDLKAASLYLYDLMVGMVCLTVLAVKRLRDSRIGRAWLALREDELACQAMGIDTTRAKLSAFALGAAWAGMAGVVFAAKTTFINPASFTFLESAIILAIVVLGGMGSIVGVAAAALVLVLLPEYLRAFAEYRMLLFGAILVGMMVFRPEGIAGSLRRSCRPAGEW